LKQIEQNNPGENGEAELFLSLKKMKVWRVPMSTNFNIKFIVKTKLTIRRYWLL